MDTNDISNYILVASDNSVALIIKQKRDKPTCDNVGGRGSHIYYWSIFPTELVLTPFLSAYYTAIPNVPLQTTKMSTDS